MLIYLLANSATRAKVQLATWVYTPSRNEESSAQNAVYAKQHARQKEHGNRKERKEKNRDIKQVMIIHAESSSVDEAGTVFCELRKKDPVICDRKEKIEM